MRLIVIILELDPPARRRAVLAVIGALVVIGAVTVTLVRLL